MTQTHKRPAVKRITAARRRLHDLVDELPPGEVRSASRYLQFLRDMTDPVLQAIRAAPEDEEPVTEEDMQAIEEGDRDARAGRLIPQGEAKRRLVGTP